MFVPMRNYGKFGFINDTPASMLPIGAWNRARNVRFKGNYIERVLEPETIDEVPSVDPAGGFPENVLWGQQFYNGSQVKIAIATATDLYVISDDRTTWDVATRDSGPYNVPDENGYWQSFAWANTVVFNNGVDIPQVWNPDTGLFVDLPRWGLITDDDGTEDFDTEARCRVMVPYKSYLVAINIVQQALPEGERVQPNTVWWSDSLTTPNLWEDLGYNPWDYASPEVLANKNLVGLEDGPLQWAATLGEGLMLYCSSSTTQMLFMGGGAVMDFRRLFEYGCAGIYGASEFKNYHLVVASDVIYIQDGNSVTQIAEDRVRDWFYRNVKNIENTCRTVTDYSAREVIIQFDASPDEFMSNAPDPARLGLVYNYEDDNFSVIDAMVDRDQLYRVNCMVYGLDLNEAGEVGDIWDNATLEWDQYGDIRWDQLQGGVTTPAVKVSMFWIADSGIYRANQLSTAAPNKTYMVRKTNMDLDEMNPQLTTNLWKHLRQVYPHIIGKGLMLARFGWSPNLEQEPTWGAWHEYNLRDEDADPDNTVPADVKIDTRTTGRYMAIEFNFDGIYDMRFSGADADVLPVYGR